MTTAFTVTFVAYDTKNSRYLYFKTDGRRFNEERTVKLTCDVKYNITITVKPLGVPQLSLQQLVIGSDEITPDSSKEAPSCMEYSFSWITAGYQPTKKAARNDVRLVFKFAEGELAQSMQAKFYPLSDSSHVVWGNPLRQLEIESCGNFQSGASPHQRYPTKRLTFK